MVRSDLLAPIVGLLLLLAATGGAEVVVERFQEGDAPFLCRVGDDVDSFRSRTHWISETAEESRRILRNEQELIFGRVQRGERGRAG